ncbi:hypothetical protein LJC27_05855 [Christensenellaceae bacterium OttesenSCG-928-M15]|nr:hypothetical protein [Christensenellaceae bacterium OttesenSCG-928-M15]
MNGLKQKVAALLCAILLAGLLPKVAMAQTVQVSDLARLKAALASPTATVIAVNTSFAIDEPLSVGRAVTLQGAPGVTLTRGTNLGDILFTLGTGANLTLRDITLDGNGSTKVYSAPLIRVMNGGALTMEAGATLQNCKLMNDIGSAVRIEPGGIFYMNGGSITQNATEGQNAAGIVTVQGTFDMSGGSISNNTVGGGAGGCVHIYDNGGTFSMSGGDISGNTASTDFGGGVFMADGKFNMRGGSISGNTAANGDGGGIYIFEGRLIMSGGSISGNTAKNGSGGGVYIAANKQSGGDLHMSGGSISGNTATDMGDDMYFEGNGHADRQSFLSGSAVIGKMAFAGQQPFYLSEAMAGGASIGIVRHDGSDPYTVVNNTGKTYALKSSDLAAFHVAEPPTTVPSGYSAIAWSETNGTFFLSQSTGITPALLVFDPNAPSDVTCTIPAGTTIITLDGAPLPAGSYTRNGTTLTLHASYLSTLANNTFALGAVVSANEVYAARLRGRASVRSDSASSSFAYRTITDAATGVTVSGQMANYARLAVRERVLHAEGHCPACDEIRARMAAGELIVLYDISVSGGYTGELEVSIPVGEQFSGQTVTILHCVNGKLESVVCIVNNGVSKGAFKKLSPFAVVRGINVSVPENTVVDPPKTGDAHGYRLAGVALVLCALGLAGIVRKKHSTNS